MNSKQIDEAMRKQLPVKYEGERYERILEYISRYDDQGRRTLSVVLLRGNNLYRVLADKVEPWEDEK